MWYATTSSDFTLSYFGVATLVRFQVGSGVEGRCRLNYLKNRAVPAGYFLCHTGHLRQITFVGATKPCSQPRK